MEQFLIQINNRPLIIGSGKTAEEARQKTLSSHPQAQCVRVIAEVSEVFDLLKRVYPIVLDYDGNHGKT